jgi:hypothetical protein
VIIIRNFLNLELLNTADGGQVIGQKVIGFDQVSQVRTTCGLIYTFQVGFDITSSQQVLAVRMSMSEGIRAGGGEWRLLSFSTSVGCRGYVVSTGTGANNCNACLSGFYPIRSLMTGEL